MAVYQIKAQPLTAEAFAPYGSVIGLPQKVDEHTLPTDRFTFYPKICTYECDGGKFQIGVSSFYKRPFRTCSLERHYTSQEFMSPLDGDIIIVFCKNKSMDRDEIADYRNCEAFIVRQDQGVVVNTGVWHWTPMPVDHDTSIICSFGYDVEVNDVDQQDFPEREVVEVVLD